MIFFQPLIFQNIMSVQSTKYTANGGHVWIRFGCSEYLCGPRHWVFFNEALLDYLGNIVARAIEHVLQLSPRVNFPSLLFGYRTPGGVEGSAGSLVNRHWQQPFLCSTDSNLEEWVVGQIKGINANLQTIYSQSNGLEFDPDYCILHLHLDLLGVNEEPSVQHHLDSLIY